MYLCDVIFIFQNNRSVSKVVFIGNSELLFLSFVFLNQYLNTRCQNNMLSHLEMLSNKAMP